MNIYIRNDKLLIYNNSTKKIRNPIVVNILL